MNSNLSVLGLSEVRRNGERIQETQFGNLLCHIGNNCGQRGVGFIIKSEWKENLIEFIGINDRIAVAKFRGIKEKRLVMIQVYAPTAQSEESECEIFYEDLSDTLGKYCNNKHQILILGDFNSQVGSRLPGEQEIMGPYNYGIRNERGERLLQFCAENRLKIVNTFYKKRKGRMWTWISPNMEHKNQIDYILAPQNTKNVLNFDVMNFEYGTDHRLIKCILNMANPHPNFKKSNGKMEGEMWIDEYKNNVNEILSKADPEDMESIDSLANFIEISINNAISKLSTTDNKNKGGGFPIEIKNLTVARENLKRMKNKTKKDKIEINLLSKTIRAKIRQYNWEKNNQVISSLLDTTKSTKKMRKNLFPGKIWATHLNDKNNKKVTSRHKMNQLATNFYEELYNEIVPLEADKLLSENIIVEESIPEISISEIETVIKTLKANKAPGSDGIYNEHIKHGGEKLTQLIHVLFCKIMNEGKTPSAWNKSDIILIYKKGDRHKVENYRPISLTPVLGKIFSKILANRLNSYLEHQQPREQAGFRRNWSTIDHLFVINQLIEKGEEYGVSFHMAFIDFAKAFDSLNYKFLIESLINQGIPKLYIKVIINLYTDLEARIITDTTGNYFKIRKGVKQGDPMSSMLFNVALEEVFKSLDLENKGLKINGEFLNNLRFADDVVMITNELEQLKQMVLELNEASKIAGLNINLSKTKIFSKSKMHEPIVIENIPLEGKDEVIYLGQLIAWDKRNEKEINRRIILAWKKFWSLKFIFKGPFSNKQKSEIFNSSVIPSLIYGSQTWVMSKKDENKMKITQNAMERSMLNIRKKDRIPTKIIKNKLKNNINAVHAIKRLKWDWAGHVARMEDRRWTSILPNWFLKTGRKPGRQKARWKDDVVKFLSTNLYHRVAQDRREWARLRESFAQRLGLYQK